MYKENEAVVFDVEEDTKIRQEKTWWIGDLQHFQSKSQGVSRSQMWSEKFLRMTPSI